MHKFLDAVNLDAASLLVILKFIAIYHKSTRSLHIQNTYVMSVSDRFWQEPTDNVNEHYYMDVW